VNEHILIAMSGFDVGHEYDANAEGRILPGLHSARCRACEIDRLRAQRDELLAVVKYAVDNSEFDSEEFDRMARSVLAKAKGE